MAILGDIRKRSWLLVITIGIAMLAFVAGDLFSENSVVKRVFTGDPNEVGSINGESISLTEFINAQNNLRAGNMSQNQISQSVWDRLVSEKIVKLHAEKAGLEVTDEEVWEFLAQQYGMGSTDELKTQIGMLKSQAQAGIQGTAQAYNNFLMSFEDAKPNILREKYLELVSLVAMTTEHEAKMHQAGSIRNATIDYGFVSYDDLKVKYDVAVTDDEINAYIKKQSKRFQTNGSVDLSYVYFPAQASKADEEATLTEIKRFLTGGIVHDSINNVTDTIAAFNSVTNDSLYVSKHSERPFIDSYITKKDIDEFAAQLPEDYVDFLRNGTVGDVGGPFKTGNAYQLVKMANTKPIADSIKSSHILISYAGSEGATRNPNITRNREQARALADSLNTVIQANPSSFLAMSNEYSDDLTAKANNGSIGWTARDSRNIAGEYLQFLLDHSKGEVDLTETKFGFHIIKVDDVKNVTGYQIANIVKEIKPSQQTSDKNFADARNFVQEAQGVSLNDFANLAQQYDYNYNSADGVSRYYTRPLIAPEANISNDKDDDILKWAFNNKTKPGSVALFTTPKEDQIIVFLASKSGKGLMSAKEARKEVESILVHQKLGAMVNEKLGANPSVDAFVAEFGGEKATTSTNFTNATIDGKGGEAAVVGSVFGMKPGQTSKAIAGNQGVYIVELKDMGPEPDVKDAEFLYDQLNQMKQQNLQSGLIQSMIKAADIKDTRMERLDRQQPMM